MPPSPHPPPTAHAAAPRRPIRLLLRRACERRPFVMLFVVAVFSNLAASLFQIGYNHELIVQTLNLRQKDAFWKVVWLNNGVMFPLCLGMAIGLFLPLARCLRDLRAGNPVEPERLRNCQRRLINLPVWQLAINLFGWLPG